VFLPDQMQGKKKNVSKRFTLTLGKCWKKQDFYIFHRGMKL